MRQAGLMNLVATIEVAVFLKVAFDKGVKLLARCKNAALALDRAAAFVAHFGFDGVAMVAVALFGFGAARIYFKSEAAVGSKFALAFGDELGRNLEDKLVTVGVACC